MAESLKQFLGKEAVPIFGWTQGVPVEEQAMQQLKNIASLPFIHKHVAVMPDVHLGKGATIGSVIPTKGAIVPAAVGVDLGCGMMAVRTSIRAEHLPDSLADIRSAIEKAVPHGRTTVGKHYDPSKDRGLWYNTPEINQIRFKELEGGLKAILEKQNDKLLNRAAAGAEKQLGTLGTGNHFIEVCLDENNDVWVMLHSGSRGIGNRIATHFIEKAQELVKMWFVHLPDVDLAYLPQGIKEFDEYVEAVEWAQRFAMVNREIMMENALNALRKFFPDMVTTEEAVNCHHNYVEMENHYGANVWLTRKGAVRARSGDLGIIPGSMGAKSYIVRGKGNPESFCSCSHGAGRVMSRGEAFRRITLDDHAKATEGVECRKDKEVIDESPAAYKDVEKVMAAQADLVDIVHTLKQVLCVKG
jgi:tRNA-splicing ligase RtcB (3'-phosphate/5'-hydroxy nucleic acid ligase)